MTDLRALLEQSRALSNAQMTSTPTKDAQKASVGADAMDVVGGDEQPRVERPLNQLEEQSRKLWQKAARTRDTTGASRAQYMLAGKGFDAERVASTLNALNVQQAFEPSMPSDDANVEEFLRHEHEMILISAIEEARQQTQDDYESAYEKHLHQSWSAAKKSIFDSIGQHRVMDDPFSRSAAANMAGINAASVPFTSPLVPSTPGAQRQVIVQNQHRAEGYVDAVKLLNDARLKNRPMPVMNAMEDACRAHNKQGSDDMLHTWNLLATMVGEATINALANGVQGTPSNRLYPVMNAGLGEREYAASYLGKPYTDNEAVLVRRRFLSGARQWLETYFCRYLDSRVAKKNGRLPLLQKIQMWTRENLNAAGTSVWEQVDGHAFWAVLFYLLRAGAKKDALEFAMAYENYLAKTEKRMIEYLSAWVSSSDLNLPSKMRTEIVNEFNVRIREGVLQSASAMSASQGGLMHAMAPPPVDPYKYLVYRILGRIGLDDVTIPQAVIQGLVGSTLGWEDAMWFQLMLVRETAEDESAPLSFAFTDGSMVSDRYTLNDLYSRYVMSHTISVWTMNNRFPYRFAHVLILSGQFERAVQYMWDIGAVPDAVHVSIALAYYGVLKISTDPQALDVDIVARVEERIGNDQFEHVALHLKRMLLKFISGWRTAKPLVALQYLLLLTLYQDGFFGAGRGPQPDSSEEMMQMARDFIVDLAFDSGSIDDFFGNLGKASVLNLFHATGPHAVRQRGYLDEYWPLLRIFSAEEFKRDMIRPAAAKAERRVINAVQHSEHGNLADAGIDVDRMQDSAILLYNLAEDYDTVLDMLARRIRDALLRHSLEPLVDSIVLSSRQMQPQSIGSHHLNGLSRTEELGRSVIDYYMKLGKVSTERMKTLLTLLRLTEFFKYVYYASQHFMQPGVQVSTRGLGTEVASASVEAQRGIALVEELGLIPAYAGMGASAPSSVMLSSDVDYTRINAKAEALRREFDDMVFSLLPSVFLGVELMLWLSWRDGGLDRKVVAAKSKQLIAFVSQIGRAYRVSSEVQRRLIAIDELMVY